MLLRIYMILLNLGLIYKILQNLDIEFNKVLHQIWFQDLLHVEQVLSDNKMMILQAFNITKMKTSCKN